MESNYTKRKREAKGKQFRAEFPDQAAAESRINAAIDDAANLAQLKTNLKEILTGGAEPGIVAALFQLDR